MPRVSVIIPTYNRIEFLMVTVESVLNQTFGDLELIIVSDGSTDNTESEINRITDNRVRFCALDKNYGYPAVARNKGLELASGEHIAFCDDDDTWTPEKLETQMKCVNNGFDFICTNFQTIDHKGVVGVLKKNSLKNLFLNNLPLELAYFFLHFHSWIVNSSVLISRDLLADFRFSEREDFRASEDYLLWIQIFQESKPIVLSEPLVYYRVHDSNISENIKENYLRCSTILSERLDDGLGLDIGNWLGSKWYFLRYKLLK